MGNWVVATTKEWNIRNFHRYFGGRPEFHLVTERAKLTPEFLVELRPEAVFLPHWSWIIPPEIHRHHRCVVFHMTDLPYGRGGSPLQNLIVRGHRDTMVSALRVDEGLDTGDIYFKEPLSLEGTAQEIFARFSDLVFGQMIPRLVEGKDQPRPQQGAPVVFDRRRPEESDLTVATTPEAAFDIIRMLDAETYPTAFLETPELRYEFRRARWVDGQLMADVRIKPKEGNR
jgi:methionyl-tRNA formyltransferase